MEDTLIEIQGLSKIFPKEKFPALDNFSATIPKGQLVGLVGPDGAGKTTLIRLLAGLLTPSSGTISVDGHDSVKGAEEIHAISGYMPQMFGLYEDLTVEQNLNLYAALKNVSKEEKQEVFPKLLQFTSLEPFKSRLAKNLSGGMKQKLGLACALLKKPKLLILDEPSVGVDPISRRELWKMVEELVDEGMSTIWSTAYLDEAAKCHSVLLLNEGKLLYNGDPKDLTDKIKGHVFKVSGIEEDRRKLLFSLLNDKTVMDGTIEGRDLRIVLKGQEKPAVPVHLETIEPRFEDAFIDILGGGPGGKSLLSETFAPIQTGVETPISVEDLSKHFGSFTAVDQITLSVKKGEIFGLLGPNGAGKTTTFKMLCGLLKPTSGKASVNNLDLLTATAKARESVGYMSQKFSLYQSLSVNQNLEFFAGIYGIHGAKRREVIGKMVEIFNLKDLLSQTTQLLPLGFKQRLSLACAIMHEPKVLFLDEPTSGVDPVTRREFWNHINSLVGKGMTIIITTHFMDEAEYCDRIALIYRGKIIELDTPNNLKKLIQSEQSPNPTLEDVFVEMIKRCDQT